MPAAKTTTHTQFDDRVLSTLNEDGTRHKIRPKLAKGRFHRRRAVVAYGLMAAFLLIPYIQMGGKPLILLDLVRREFTFFGATFLPTDTILLMLLGLGLVLSIFILTALFGRVWCGWACPQTVYLEFLYRPIERLIEGSPQQQRKLDEQGLSGRRLLKYGVFLVVSMFVAHTFLAYFVGVERLLEWVQRSPLEHPASFLVMAAVTGLMFFDFAYFREQMCIVTCPYGRLQSVLLDKRSLIVGYDTARGEPRGKPAKAGQAARAGKVEDSAPRGDCIDCGACVYTCPTGIDIRNGLQMECIGCTQCIDACDAIMDRIHKPRGLIRYTSEDELAGKGRRLLRPRLIVYPVILAVVVTIFAINLGGKPAAEVTALRNAASPFTLIQGDRVSNPVRLKLINRTDSDRAYAVELLDAPDAELIAPQNPVPVAAGGKVESAFIVISPRRAYTDGARWVRFRVHDDSIDTTIRYELLGPTGPTGPAPGAGGTP